MFYPAMQIRLALILILALSAPRLSGAAEITIAVTEWPPFTSQALPGGGFFTAICQAGLTEAGHRSNVVFLPWKRALDWTEKGKAQAVIGVGYTQQRAHRFIYPRTCLEVPVHFFATQGHRFGFRTAKDLCPAVLGVFLGSNYAEEFERVGCFDIQPVPSVTQNIKKLALNRIDLFIESYQAVMYHLNNDHPELLDRIVPLDPPFRIERAYMVFTRQMPQAEQISREFDRAVERLKTRGVYDGILKRHSVAR